MVWIYSIIKTENKDSLMGICLFFPAIVWTFSYLEVFALHEAWWKLEILEAGENQMGIFLSFIGWLGRGPVSRLS